jgi:arginine N-succinyltransferase
MLVIRPVTEQDLDNLYELASLSEPGLTTLPYQRGILKRSIKRSVRSFEDFADKPGGELYFFVLQDTENQKIVGTCAIYAKVGGFEPFYTYKVKTITTSSSLLNVCKTIQYLQLVKNHNGPSEIGTLFLSPHCRQKGCGKLLSLSRFLFMAQYPQCFERAVIAEMRGVLDDNGQSPFWEALGQHFFEVDFKKADLMVMQDKSFIADLIPEHPIYIPLLPPAAQAVIGKVHKNTQGALHMLIKEGFQVIDEIDIFEAGPVVRAQVDDIRSVRESRVAALGSLRKEQILGETYLVANVNHHQDFRVVMTELKESPQGVLLNIKAAETLQVSEGSQLRYVKI